MLPLRDINPARSTPLVTAGILALCAFVFFSVQPRQEDEAVTFLYEQASIPCEVTTGQPLSIDEIRDGGCRRDAAAPVFPEKRVWWSVLASVFFHGDLLHLVSNLWVLWVFGNNVEDAMGKGRYALFYLVAGFLASLAHVFLYPQSTIPVVGASGAIAGVMGAYLVLFPSARVVSIVPPFFFFTFEVPALIFLLVWFVGQFALAGAQTAIAWEAHVAGFLVGTVYALVARRRFRRTAYA